MREPRKTGRGRWLHLEMWRTQQEKNRVEMSRDRPIRQQRKKGLQSWESSVKARCLSRTDPTKLKQKNKGKAKAFPDKQS